MKFLSPAVQNGLIYIISRKIIDQVQDEIKQAIFVSVILDTMQDIAKVDQLSTMFRYVKIKADEQKTGYSH